MFYLVPSLFFFAIAFSLFLQPGVFARQNSLNIRPQRNKKISIALILLIFFNISLLVLRFGHVRRDQETVAIAKYVKEHLPQDINIDVRPRGDWNLACYLQRYHRITSQMDKKLKSNLLITRHNKKELKKRVKGGYKVLYKNKRYLLLKTLN